MQAIDQKNYGGVKSCNYIVSLCPSQTVNSLPVVIRPQSVSTDHTLFLFFFNSYTTVPVSRWVAEKSWNARKTCAQEKVFLERKTRCFLPLSVVQINSIQPLLYVFSAIIAPLLYVFSALIVPLLFIYALIFLALLYGDYLRA